MCVAANKIKNDVGEDMKTHLNILLVTAEASLDFQWTQTLMFANRETTFSAFSSSRS